MSLSKEQQDHDDTIYNIAQLDKVTSHLNSPNILIGTNQIANILTSFQCKLQHARNYGDSFIIYSDTEWNVVRF